MNSIKAKLLVLSAAGVHQSITSVTAVRLHGRSHLHQEDDDNGEQGTETVSKPGGCCSKGEEPKVEDEGAPKESEGNWLEAKIEDHLPWHHHHHHHHHNTKFWPWTIIDMVCCTSACYYGPVGYFRHQRLLKAYYSDLKIKIAQVEGPVQVPKPKKQYQGIAPWSGYLDFPDAGATESAITLDDCTGVIFNKHKGRKESFQKLAWTLASMLCFCLLWLVAIGSTWSVVSWMRGHGSWFSGMFVPKC